MAKSRKPKNSAVVQKAGTALDMLVKQFSQPLACLRELVQNSIDAGSNDIEVTLDPELEEGCFRLTVADTGEGMTEEIIGSQLTRLFSSNKENDLTKVGKFGIGFVSVFALDPVAVVVDTGREGQCWRVLFHPDRSYDLIQLEERVEGTRVTLYLPQTRFTFSTLLADVEKTLRFWCRHCNVRITVNGKEVGEPFTLEQPVAVSYSEPGTRLVVAPAVSDNEFFGFYNQGLTLWEGSGGPLKHLTYKIDSRYFEHTLTRDKLIENEDYTKAIRLLQTVAREQYPPALFEALLSSDSPFLWNRLDLLPLIGVPDKEIRSARLLKDHAGTAYSLDSLKGCRVFFHAHSDALQEAVHQQKAKRVVLHLTEHHPALEFLQKLGVRALSLCSHWALCEAQEGTDLEALSAACRKLPSAVAVRRLVAVRWLVGQGAQSLVFQASDAGAVELGRVPNAHDPVLLNVEHPGFAHLQSLARWNPPLAAQLIVQHLLLLRPDSERSALSQALTAACLEQLQRAAR